MFVYLIGSDAGYYKIGRSFCPELRLEQLDGTKLPFELKLRAEYEVGEKDAQVEKLLKSHFDSRRIRGEWYTRISTSAFLRSAKRFEQESENPPMPDPKYYMADGTPVPSDKQRRRHAQRLRLLVHQYKKFKITESEYKEQIKEIR